MDNQQERQLTSIPDFKGYYFCEEGHIYSDRRGKIKRLKEHKHGGKTKKIYYRVKLWDKCYLVHRLIGAYLAGRKLLPDEHVNHIDGDTENNRPLNLEIVSHKGNVEHAVKNKLYCSGEAWYIARGKL